MYLLDGFVADTVYIAPHTAGPNRLLFFVFPFYANRNVRPAFDGAS